MLMLMLWTFIRSHFNHSPRPLQGPCAAAKQLCRIRAELRAKRAIPCRIASEASDYDEEKEIVQRSCTISCIIASEASDYAEKKDILQRSCKISCIIASAASDSAEKNKAKLHDLVQNCERSERLCRKEKRAKLQNRERGSNQLYYLKCQINDKY